jgi:hypothetical protein
VRTDTNRLIRLQSLLNGFYRFKWIGAEAEKIHKPIRKQFEQIGRFLEDKYVCNDKAKHLVQDSFVGETKNIDNDHHPLGKELHRSSAYGQSSGSWQDQR